MEDFQYLALTSEVELSYNINDFSGPTFYIPPQCSIVDLEKEIKYTKTNVKILEQSILEKKELLLRKCMDAKKCLVDKADINQKQARLLECNVRLEATTKAVLSKLLKTNEAIYSLRRENIHELFEKYLPIRAFPTPTAELDSIAGVKLNVDSRNLTIPEPTISSHAALNLMILAQRALTRILNACIPVDTRQIFNLNTFDVNAPTRDNITHVYRVVCQLIQILAEISSRQAVSSKSSKYVEVARESRDRPLLALYYLVKAFEHDNFQSWTFDSPYILPRVDMFSPIDYEMAMYPPHTGSNSLKHGITIRVQRTGKISSMPSSGSFSIRNELNSSSDSEGWDIVDEDD
nr:cassette chromosome recombinase b [Hymenolepis microstoma]